MNGVSEYLVLVWLFSPLVVHTFIAHLAIRDDLVPTIAFQDETPLQAPVVIDVEVYHCASEDDWCGVFVTHVCAEGKHLYVESDPTSEYGPAFRRLLLFHGVSVPSEVLIDPLLDVISTHDTKVSQSIIGEIENLGLPGMYPHKDVCHDGDEALVVLVHAIQNVLLRYLIELTGFIEHEVDGFHFLLTVIVWQLNPQLISLLIEAKVLLVIFSFIYSLYISLSTV